MRTLLARKCWKSAETAQSVTVKADIAENTTKTDWRSFELG
jgi:hypothetical protein